MTTWATPITQTPLALADSGQEAPDTQPNPIPWTAAQLTPDRPAPRHLEGLPARVHRVLVDADRQPAPDIPIDWRKPSSHRHRGNT